MSTPVIQSFNTYNWTANTSPVITKPTGLAVGNLLLAIICSVDNAGSAVDDPTTPAGWTRFSNAFFDSASDTVKAFGFYKVADAGDVAASNFTFVCETASAVNAGYLARITGFNTSAPISAIHFANGTETTNPTVSGASISTFTNDSLLFMAFCGIASGGTETISNYTIDGGSNPTWTEVFDSASSTGVNEIIAIATASETAVRTVTQFECDITVAIGNNVGQFFVLAPQTNSTGTNATFAVSPTLFSNTGVVVGTTGTNTLLAVSPNLPSQSGSATTGTVWVNEAEATTTWVNESL